ncbi:MAG: 23S rRNA (uracil(1939)-C(5))-methyltransferase RlmD [Eubacterium sp.]|nr:23S rRNA (uracil(1939)-C(5))-methyltransferase RlmD [Eubacterium sp.]
MKKGEVYEGVVVKVTYPNKGHVRLEDQNGVEKEVIVKNTIPGQTICFRIRKKKAGVIEGQLLSVIKPSESETEDPGCNLFPECGGCTYRTLPYQTQLKLKEQEIRLLISHALTAGDHIPENLSEPIEEGIIPSPQKNAYRNKMEYAFGDCEKGGELTLGLHKKNSTYDILTADHCQIVHNDFNLILRTVLSFCRAQGWTYYHKMTHQGYLRHLLVRRASATGEILVDLVTSSQSEGAAFPEKPFAGQLLQLQLEGKIVGILHTINDSVADVIKNDRTDLLYGRDFFYENLLGLCFKITPFSFFQTNSRGAEVLYRTAREFLGDVHDQTVFDLYSGTGTIAQIIAPVAGKVIGVEIVEEAVEAARENAQRNHLQNCRFLCGDVLKVLDKITEKPDAIILDPPREGVHPKALPKIIAYGVRNIIYISCKPTSLARDLPVFLEHGYRLVRYKCVDLFPDTVHVETVVLMSRVEGK